LPVFEIVTVLMLHVHMCVSQVGEVRRLYIPGNLAFSKPLRAAAGR
jgi:hypothetical protein